MSFTFGPEWARDTGCCAKPAGCTNMSPACLMRGHPWKRRHAQATPAAGRTDMIAEMDVLELGMRAAAWLAAAAGQPGFMLAGHILRARPPRRRIRTGDL